MPGFPTPILPCILGKWQADNTHVSCLNAYIICFGDLKPKQAGHLHPLSYKLRKSILRPFQLLSRGSKTGSEENLQKKQETM